MFENEKEMEPNKIGQNYIVETKAIECIVKKEYSGFASCK